ncbi:MAG: hypothetical protein AAGE52_06035 [Myxococcota bacterium]
MRWVFLVALVACGEAPQPDFRFHTPKATVDTLLESYGLERVSQEEVRRRMQIGRTFHLVDPAARDACFDRAVTADDEGLIGYVFGSLAPTKDNMPITITEDVAHVFGETLEGRRNTPVVLHPDGEGNWKISIEESVPASVRTRLAEARDDP